MRQNEHVVAPDGTRAYLVRLRRDDVSTVSRALVITSRCVAADKFRSEAGASGSPENSGPIAHRAEACDCDTGTVAANTARPTEAGVTSS